MDLKLPIDVLLGTNSDDYHALASLQKQPRGTILESKITAVIKHRNTGPNAVFNGKDEKMMMVKLLHEIDNKSKKDKTQSAFARAAKLMMFEPLCVALLMALTK